MGRGADLLKLLAAGSAATLAVTLLPGAASARSSAVLPDLVPLYTENLIGPVTDLADNGIPLNIVPVLVDGCLPDEMARRGARRCIRFDSRVANIGEGAFEVEYKQEGTGFVAYQHVYNADGSFEEREAVATEYHPTHVHFHIEDFYVATIWQVGRKGLPKRSIPPVATGDKNGFCPGDSASLDGDNEGRTYDCFSPTDPRVPTSLVGISPGWMDIYQADLPDQYVEISEVGDGRYILELEIDPADVFVESNELNNRVCSLIELQDTTARMLATEVSCLKAK